MDAATRHERYHAMDRAVTAPQRRRMKHKSRGRKTHAHKQGETCVICRPGWSPARDRRPISTWDDEAVRFRPYNRSWMQAISGGKSAGKTSGHPQVPGPRV